MLDNERGEQNNVAKLSFVVPGTPLAKKRHRTVPMSQCVGCKKMVHGNFHQCPDCSQSLRFIKNVSYSDSESVRYENLVSFCARQEMLKQKIEQPFTKTVTVEAAFTFPIPVSRKCSKLEHSPNHYPHIETLVVMKQVQEARNGCKKVHPGDRHPQKPDFDNAIKSIVDGLNTILFVDDCQVSDAIIRKRWGEAGQAVITVEEL